MPTRRDALLLIPFGLAAAGGYAWMSRDGGSTALPDLPGISAANAQEAGEVEEITLGDADAPVKVVEYASFTCPHCANFHNDTFKDFKREYIDTGKVHFTYREVFFDRFGLWAAMIARCAGPVRYFGVADILYRTQSDWARAGDPAAVAGALKKVGAQAGLTEAELDACLQDAGQAEALVGWYQRNAQRDNIRSTPSFLIDGELHSGNMTLQQLGRLVDAAAG